MNHKANQEHETFTLNGKTMKMFISKEHRFNTDSVLLAKFARNAKLKDKIVVDLCSGCGIIPMILLQSVQSVQNEHTPLKIYSVEIQQEAADLLRQTIEYNNLTEIELIQQDLRNKLDIKQADTVTVNPPYFPKQSGFERESSPQKTARYETECTLEDVIVAANRLLKYGGDLKMCMTASRLAETTGLMQTHGIEPKEIVLIPSANTDKARLFLISGKKGGKPGVTVTWKKD